MDHSLLDLDFMSLSFTVVLGAGPDQPCARPEATVAARPLKKTDIVLTRPILITGGLFKGSF